MAAKPKSINKYLARVSIEKRAALEKRRRDIKSAAVDLPLLRYAEERRP
jgi:hypothetical protein